MNEHVKMKVLEDGRLRMVVPNDAIVTFDPFLATLRKPPHEFVGVKFKEYDSPSAAAADATLGSFESNVWTYRAVKALKLTVGDRVLVPGQHGVPKLATVVLLNGADPTPACGYCKDVLRRA